MALQFDPVAVVVGGVTAVVGVVVAVTGARLGGREDDWEVTAPVCALGGSVTLWAAADVAETLAAGVAAKLSFSGLAFVGAGATVGAFLLSGIALSGRRHWLRPAVPVVAAEPVVVAAGTLTNAFHGLFFASARVDVQDGATELALAYGPILWGHTLYATLAAAVASALLVYGSVGRARTGVALVVAAALPWVANVAYVAGLVPVDPTPLAMGVAGLLALVPLARGNTGKGGRERESAPTASWSG